MALILSIETSTHGCSTALHNRGILIGNAELFKKKSSAEMLTTLISNVLNEAGKGFDDLNAVAISKGPGSYTGLRIGVSTAKGICFAADLPLLSVNSLDLMTAQARELFEEGSLCPMLDARRMEVYCKLVNARGKEILPTAAMVIDDSAFDSYLIKDKILFCGEGAEKCKTVIKSANASFLGDEIRPKASFMGSIVYEKYVRGDFEAVSSFEPYYLKEFVGTTPAKNRKVTA